MPTADAGAEAFARYAEHLPEALLVVDGDGTVLSANRAAAALLGRPATAFPQRPLGELMADGADGAAALVRAGSRSQTPLPCALRLLRGDAAAAEGVLHARGETVLLAPRDGGRPAVLVLRLAPHHRSVQQFLALNDRIEQLGREVARRRAAEAQLQAYGERLRVTLASIGDAVIATDAAGRVILMNAVAQGLTGWTEDEATGRPLGEVFVIIQEGSRLPVENPVVKVLREGNIVALANHTVLIARDGSERPIDDSGAPIRDADGRLIGVVLVFRDFTERRGLEQELQQQAALLVEAGHRKDEFLSMLAHELRNPLAPMMTGLQLLQPHALRHAEVGRVAGMMQRQLAHLTRLVDDLLDVARLTHGKIELRRQPVALPQVLRQAVDMVLPLAAERRQELSIDGATLSAVVDADTTRLVQVFANLLSNAVKFTPDGGHISLHAGLAADGSAVNVIVRDDGIGIDATLLPQVFDLFVQADRSLDRSQGGLGIGLSVVRTIVELHGGRVAIHSRGHGEGTEVHVELPLPSFAHSPTGHRGDEFAQGSASPLPLKVLVVDDNQDAVETLVELLRHWGHDADTAGDGPTALTRVQHWVPDVVLLDIGLPGMSGHEVARRLTATSPAPPLLVALTGYGSPADQKASRDVGFDAHLTKPVDLDALQALLMRRAEIPRRSTDAS
ncbi:MAG: ATP-binding protein [Rubrivivax sp.]